MEGKLVIAKKGLYQKYLECNNPNMKVDTTRDEMWYKG